MLTPTIATAPDTRHVSAPAAPAPAFPSPDLVLAAAGMFAVERVPERVESYGAAFEKSISLGFLDGARRATTAGRRALVEGVRWRVEVGPGVVAVRSFDPARGERAHERLVRAHRVDTDLRAARINAGETDPETAPARAVRYWSGKSRARMVQRLSELDFGPMFADGGRPADVTLTLPGDWLTVAPDAATCHKMLLRLRKRYERATGRRWHAVWKREFQGRGAPHWHIFSVLPERIGQESTREWFGRVWSEVVAHPDDDERARHRVAGVAVDFAEGARRSDPRRLAAYFSKHGAFAAKDYQNLPPAEWGESPVGRFWGYWHLERAVAGVEVAPDVALAASRTARRYARAHRFYVSAERWRKVTTLDRETGEVGFKWRRRRVKVPVERFRTKAGFLVVNDGPAFAAALARASEAMVRPTGRLAGPVGFLP